MACKRSNSSAETVAGNDDLLTEGILLRLPPKSLVRFQMVCKHWRSLIFSPSFGRVHTRRSTHSGSGTFILTPSDSDVIHFNPVSKAIHKFKIPHSSKIKIIQSSNGLWLLEFDGGKNYSVHNPTTKQSRVLELLRPRADGPRATGLCFDPSISIHYKVLFIYSEDEEQSRIRVETFDSETDEWTSAYYPSELLFQQRPELYDWIYLNNKLYSMSLAIFVSSCLLDPQTGNVVRVPNVNLTGVAVTYSTFDNPCFYNHKGSNGRLHCALIGQYYDNTCSRKRYLLLFELAEDNSGWLKLCNVDMTRILGVDIRTRNVSVMRGADQREGHVLLHVEGGMVISYRFCDGKWELVLDRKACETLPDDLMSIMKSPFFGLHKIFPFRQNLAPV